MKALEIFGEDVALQVHTIAFFYRVKASDRVGVGDDPESEAVFLVVYIGHGEAGAVDGDAAFVGDVAGEFWREREVEAVIRADLVVEEDFCGGIDVALHDVAGHAVGGADGAFEVYGVVFLERAEVGCAEGFGEDIEADDSVKDTGDGEAAAVHCDAFAESKLGGEGNLKGELSAVFLGRDGAYDAE